MRNHVFTLLFWKTGDGSRLVLGELLVVQKLLAGFGKVSADSQAVRDAAFRLVELLCQDGPQLDVLVLLPEVGIGLAEHGEVIRHCGVAIGPLRRRHVALADVSRVEKKDSLLVVALPQLKALRRHHLPGLAVLLG